jgi:hypothetical protein
MKGIGTSLGLTLLVVTLTYGGPSQTEGSLERPFSQGQRSSRGQW